MNRWSSGNTAGIARRSVKATTAHFRLLALSGLDWMGRDNMAIEIKCRGADSLPLDAIEEFQGNLKKRTKADIEKIITSIQKYGFSFPFFVWNGTGHNYCLDGHGRIQALAEMRRRGESLPLFPIVYVEATDEAEAKQKLLRLNSNYGQMSVDSVLEFATGLDVEWTDLSLPSGFNLAIVAPDFQPVDIEEQGRLDEKQKHICPECGCEF